MFRKVVTRSVFTWARSTSAAHQDVWLDSRFEDYLKFSLSRKHTCTHTLVPFYHQCSNQNHSRSKLAWSLHTPRPAFSLRSGTHVQWNQHVCSMFPGGCQAEPAEARSAVICQAHYSHKCDGCEPCECETVGGIKRKREREGEQGTSLLLLSSHSVWERAMLCANGTNYAPESTADGLVLQQKR